LSKRLGCIAGRKQIGYWECDTVIGANHKQAIVTVVERKSRYALAAKVSNKMANMISYVIIEAPTPFEPRVKTLNYDSGREFCGHALIDEALKSTGFFARLFANWERGSNGNVNGMLRQCVSKKRPMKNINH